MKYSDVEREPTMTEYLLMDDYDAGDEAYINGVQLTDNPHPPGSKRAIAWSDGWQTSANAS